MSGRILIARRVGVAATALALVSLAAGPAQASSWTVEPTPNAVSGGQYDQNVVPGVDCASASACMGVGYATSNNGSYVSKALAMRWDGSSWRLAMPSSDASLTNVSCVSATKCFAVGTGQKPNYRDVPVILRWNGKKWSTMTVPLRRNQIEQSVGGIACPTSTSCLAVGGSSNGPGSIFHTLVYHYDGSSWSIIKSPNPSTTTSGGGTFFSDVSCWRASKCFAAGYAGQAMLIERWRGGARWKRQTVPQPAGYEFVNAISCTSGSSCTSVGVDQSTDGGQDALALTYDGSAWHVHLFSQAYSALSDVSCTAKGCVAVGDAGSARQPFVVRYATGRWRTMTAATAGASTNYLGVSCWAGSSCRAVGSKSNDNQSSQTFAAVHP